MPRGLRSSSVNVPVCDTITARAIDNPSPNPLLLFMPRAASPRISKTYRPDPVRRVNDGREPERTRRLGRQGLLAEEERDNGAALKKAIECVISDMAFELQSETAERTRARV